MNKVLQDLLARFKALPALYRFFILAGLALIVGSAALDFGHGLGKGLFALTH
jgi:hypothetical protein